MSATNHTTGPWMANADTVWRKIAGQGAEIVCHPINHPQSIADARLIAAAPELLAALECWLSLHDGACAKFQNKDADFTPEVCTVLTAARAAIAKAKGAA